MAGKLIWFAVILIVTGTISASLVMTNGTLITNAKAYVQSFD